MGKAGSTVVYAGAWFAWLLDFIGWVILLAGVSAMQSVRETNIKFNEASEILK
jgi:hypothetical protein